MSSTMENVGFKNAAPCPLCATREGLQLRTAGSASTDGQVRSYCEVGCGHCDRWFRGPREEFAFARWNSFAAVEWRNRGAAGECAGSRGRPAPGPRLDDVVLERCREWLGLASGDAVLSFREPDAARRLKYLREHLARTVHR